MVMNRDPEQTELRYLQTFVDFKNANLLEVGCGDGRLTWRYAEQSQQVTAIDPDMGRLVNAVEARPQNLHDRVRFMRSHAEQLPFADQTFDGVILAWSL